MTVTPVGKPGAHIAARGLAVRGGTSGLGEAVSGSGGP